MSSLSRMSETEKCRPPPNARPPNPPLLRPGPKDERLLLACFSPLVRGWRGLYVGLTRRVGNCPLVEEDLVVVRELLLVLDVVDAVLLLVVALVGFDGDDVDVDEVDGDDVAALGVAIEPAGQ